MIVAVHSRQLKYRNTSLTPQELRVPNVHFTLLGNSRFKKRLLVTVSFAVTSTHLLSHPAAQHLERNATSVKKGHFAQVCKELSAEGSQLAYRSHELNLLYLAVDGNFTP